MVTILQNANIKDSSWLLKESKIRVFSNKRYEHWNWFGMFIAVTGSEQKLEASS